VFCNRCGHENPARSLFCASCGARLAQRGSDETTASYVPIGDEDRGRPDDIPPGAGLLVVEKGPNAGSRYLIDQDLVRLGRDPEADILLDDVTVSRRHAEVRKASGGFAIHDDGSLNGTYLNRRRIEHATLHNGDEIQIGRFRLVFHDSSVAEVSA